jgi:hypothetical protein
VIRKLLDRYRRGRLYEGVVVYTGDPMIPGVLPGHYGTKKDGSPDLKCRLKFIEAPDGSQIGSRWERA